jgi:tRNA A37 threonylcarbamoyladenosine synthetase subunit TsaC/SUA5/YrdC
LGLNETDLQKVAHLWPNSISVVLPAPPHLDYLDQEVGSLAVRIPADPTIQALLEVCGPLLTSSANHPGEGPANTIAEAQAYFGDAVDLYVDGGDRSAQPASTVARLEADGSLRVLRQGAIQLTKEGAIA